MTKKPDSTRESADAPMNAAEVEAWFVREVLPLEPQLMQFLSHNWRNKSEIADLRQEVYALLCEATQDGPPEHPRAFLFKTARNLLINRMRREQIVPIEAAADLEGLNIALDTPSPERSAIARDELRRLQVALDRLPPRCREAVILGRIEGLSGPEIANRMGVTKSTVSVHLANGIRALSDMLNAPRDDVGRAP